MTKFYVMLKSFQSKLLIQVEHFNIEIAQENFPLPRTIRQEINCSLPACPSANSRKSQVYIKTNELAAIIQ